MTTISRLPQDLEEEILCRVPMTSLGAMRSTCKLWNTLSKDPSFIDRNKAVKETMMIVIYRYKACLVTFNIQDDKDLVNPFMKLIGKLKQVDIIKVFHSSGLLLCLAYEHNKLKLLVWNPFTGHTRWIQPRTDDYLLCRHFYGLGYDSNKNHKILKVPYWFRDNNVDCEIYDFKSQSWRVLGISMDWNIDEHGVSLKGDNYIVGRERTRVMGEAGLRECLICFDFTRERVWGDPLPRLTTGSGNVHYRGISVVSEEKLAVLYGVWRSGQLELEIWITNKIESNAVSWNSTYFLNVQIPSSYVVYGLGESFFVDEKKKVAVLFGIDRQDRTTNVMKYKALLVTKSGHYREMNFGDSKCRIFRCSPYVPSLMQIH